METILPHPAADPRRRSSLYQSVRQLDPGLDPTSAIFKAALVVFCGQRTGPNVDRIANRTGIDRTFVARCVRRLVDAGVWSGATASGTESYHQRTTAFWNDVTVAEGTFWRRIGPGGQVEWAPAGSWIKEYDFVPAHEQGGLANVYHDRPSYPEPDPVVRSAARRRARARVERRGIRVLGHRPRRRSPGAAAVSRELSGPQPAFLGDDPLLRTRSADVLWIR